MGNRQQATGNRQQATGNRQQATHILIAALLLFNLTTTQAGAVGNTVSSANNWRDLYTGPLYDSPMEACVATQTYINAHPPGFTLTNPSVIPPASSTGYWNCMYGVTPAPPVTELSFTTTTSLIYRFFICPVHSSIIATDQITGGTCACHTNFKFIPDGAGKNCVCPEDMQLDPTGIRCVLETYTIALSDLGGEVRASEARVAYAEVRTNEGAVKPGAQVSLTLSVVPDDDGQIAINHEGRLLPVAGNTGGDGRLSFVFVAPIAGGTHTITASCNKCTNEATGTIIVSGCQIPRLTSPPFTDPVAEGFENGNRWRPDKLTADYQTKLTCVQNAITAAGGTYTGTSAYRPYQYQQHLFEIVQKDKQLNSGYMSTHPECQTLRSKITAEMSTSKHSLKSKQKVATPGTSKHESGTAFDLTPFGVTEAQQTTINTGCGVSHTAVSGEPWHIQ